jgi:homoserine dehydrogenase
MTKNKVSFAVALARAQKAGFAEADPAFDVEGIDTAHKLSVLSSLAWSSWVRLDDIAVTGITGVTEDDVFFARRFGYVIKLLGSAVMREGGLDLSVQPCLVAEKHAFATVEQEYNAVLIQGDSSGDVMFYGKGAGQLPAASAVVSDIIDLSRQVASGTAGRVPYITYDQKRRIKVLSPEKRLGSFYLRFSTEDRPGVLGKISGILGKHHISIATVYQEEPLTTYRRKGVPIIILTHLSCQGDLFKALKEIDRLPFVKAKTVKYKIQR